MKKVIIVLIVIISIATVFSGCYYDKADLVYPKTSCDTTNMTYTTSIRSIISTNCNVCHGGTAAGAQGIKLDSYSALKGQGSTGELMRRLTTTDPIKMMPQGGPRLSDCDIAKINWWVNHGSPQ
jgi:cytochrome c553